MKPTVRSRERVKASGEVFTPPELVNEMLDKLPPEVWIDKAKTFIDPAAGNGNFLIEVKRRLLAAGRSEVHILEHQLFAIEIMPDNLIELQHRLGYLINGRPNHKLKFEHFRYEHVTHDACGTILNEDVLHHRNMVCANALEYDYSFQRNEDGSDIVETKQKQLLEW